MNGGSRAKDLFQEFQREGKTLIDRMIAEQVTEELFLDYKVVTNHGNSTKLEIFDKLNYAKAISGFGNSEGGLIIWGVKCDRDETQTDIPRETKPITNVSRFVGNLQSATSGCTLPPHTGVQHHPIVDSDGKGFVVTYIPKSLHSPHQVIAGQSNEHRCLIRVGSSFVVASHGLLSGMFGKRPSPFVSMMWGAGGKMSPASWGGVFRNAPNSTPYALLEPAIENSSVVLARDIYLNFSMQAPGANCVLEVQKLDDRFEFHATKWGYHLLFQESARLAPLAKISTFRAEIYLRPPFENPLSWVLTAGCTGSPVQRVEATIGVDVLRLAYEEFVKSDHSQAMGHQFASAVLDLDRVGENYRASYPLPEM